MRNYIIRVIKFLIILVILIGSYLVLIYIYPSLVDPFYYRVTTEKSSSLIIGSSRSAQGIVPFIINDEIFEGEKKIINHSFAGDLSKYGPRYFREIKNKIKPEKGNNIFILSVNPWVLSTNIANIEDDTLLFSENINNYFIGNMSSSSSNPNFEYLFKYWSRKSNPMIDIIKKISNYKNSMKLHSDGWLEVNVPSDQIYSDQKINNGLQKYIRRKLKFSQTRLNYLEQIILYLKEYGQVYLVRLPISQDMHSLENKEFGNFDSLMNDLALNYSLHYINFISESGNFLTNDVSHLNKIAGIEVTKQLCDSIKSY